MWLSVNTLKGIIPYSAEDESRLKEKKVHIYGKERERKKKEKEIRNIHWWKRATQCNEKLWKSPSWFREEARVKTLQIIFVII